MVFCGYLETEVAKMGRMVCTCGKVLKEDYKLTRPGDSHGICKACLKKKKQQIADYKAKRLRELRMEK